MIRKKIITREVDAPNGNYKIILVEHIEIEEPDPIVEEEKAVQEEPTAESEEQITKKHKKKRPRKTDPEARLNALERDNYTCQECGATGEMEVHHIKYRSDNGSDDLDNLITLCPLCHAEQHKGEPIYNLMMARIESRNDGIFNL